MSMETVLGGLPPVVPVICKLPLEELAWVSTKINTRHLFCTLSIQDVIMVTLFRIDLALSGPAFIYMTTFRSYIADEYCEEGQRKRNSTPDLVWSPGKLTVQFGAQ